MIANNKILIVGQHAEDFSKISSYLTFNEFSVKFANNESECFDILNRWQPNYILVDEIMNDKPSFPLCAKIRNQHHNPNILIFMLASSTSNVQKERRAFESGVNDFIRKPVDPVVLTYRFQKTIPVQQTTSANSNHGYELGKLSIDPESFSIKIEGSKIDLSRKEFDLLMLLATNRGKVCRRETIFNKVWHTSQSLQNRSIDVYIRRLRKYIGDDSIKTIKGVGYKLMI